MNWLRRTAQRNRRRAGSRPPVRLGFDLFENRLLLTAYLVNSSADGNTGSGSNGTLRWVLNQLAATGSNDTNEIDFGIASSGVQTINLGSDLPPITKPVLIKGYTEGGAAPNSQSIGTNAAITLQLDLNGYAGLVFNSGSANSLVQGLSIFGGAEIGGSAAGISINADDITVSGDFIGIQADGTTVDSNANGVVVASGVTGVQIGSSSLADRNLISGNTGAGVSISGTAQVQGNLIGTDSAGSCTLLTPTDVCATENGGSGVFLGQDGGNNTIGGSVDGARNVISGNGANGVDIEGSLNCVEGNYIGTDSSGSCKLSPAGTATTQNGGSGVFLGSTASNNTIGGLVAGARNVISGNAADGVDIEVGVGGAAKGGNYVEGNYIGTDSTGSGKIEDGLFPTENGGAGVSIGHSASHNTIGGSAPSARNVISCNYGDGVDIGGNNNCVEGNYIGTDPSGSISQGNFGSGVLLLKGAFANTIGGINGPGPDGTPLLTQGNLISGNFANGVDVGAGANLVEGNYIGTDASGSRALPNIGSGVFMGSASGADTIGGSVDAARNIISGNFANGVDIDGGGHNYVLGNYIGTDYKGSSLLPNYGNGVFIGTGAYGNIIGESVNQETGAIAFKRNVISGNLANGVDIEGGSIANGGNLVLGNYIGTDASGSSSLQNRGNGVFIGSGASYNTIGGSGAAARNIISGNGANGVDIEGGVNCVEGNYIGTDFSGLIALANGGNGVFMASGASGNSIGGSGVSMRNVLSGNARAGVELTGDSTSGNQVAGNYIGTDSSGSNPVSNGIGVLISDAVSNIIGGTDPASRNVISGNSSSGVVILGSGPTNDQLIGNFIGPDASGDTALPASALNDPTKAVQQTGILVVGAVGNFIGESGAPLNVISGNIVGIEFTGIIATSSQPTNTVTNDYIGIGNDQKALGNVTGIWIDNVPNTQIGGTTPGEINIIAGNSQGGVYISGANAKNNMVQGNKIGLGPSGQIYPAAGHKKDPTYQFPIGVYIENASFNIIGGTKPGERNTISGNSVGVYIFGANGSAQGSKISGNAINSNERYGILFFNAPFNTNSRNQFAKNRIANFREFSGPVAKAQTRSSGQGSGTRAKKAARHTNHAAHQSLGRTASSALVTVHGRQVPAGPMRKPRARAG